MSIKEDQGRTLVVHQTAEYDARRLIHLQTAGKVAQIRLKPLQCRTTNFKSMREA